MCDNRDTEGFYVLRRRTEPKKYEFIQCREDGSKIGDRELIVLDEPLNMIIANDPTKWKDAVLSSVACRGLPRPEDSKFRTAKKHPLRYVLRIAINHWIGIRTIIKGSSRVNGRTDYDRYYIYQHPSKKLSDFDIIDDIPSLEEWIHREARQSKVIAERYEDNLAEDEELRDNATFVVIYADGSYTFKMNSSITKFYRELHFSGNLEKYTISTNRYLF